MKKPITNKTPVLTPEDVRGMAHELECLAKLMKSKGLVAEGGVSLEKDLDLQTKSVGFAVVSFYGNQPKFEFSCRVKVL